MIQRSPVTDPLLDDMTRALVDGFHPSRIVLFGSRARGDGREDSDYDLMVELDTTLEYNEIRRAIWHALAAFGSAFDVDVKIRRPGEFDRRRDDPGTIDYDIAREGVILHPPEDRGPMLPRALPLRVREPDPGRPASVEAWLGLADLDLEMMELGLAATRIPWVGVVFHAQQAAEKYLKALLVARWKKPPRTHDLNELVVEARTVGCDLPDLSAECEGLKRYGVDVRYPEMQPIPTETEGRDAVAAARRIVDAVRAAL